MTRNLTCIICPVGCPLSVEIEKGKIINVSGNTCKKGESYAVEECISPKRTLTSTIITNSGRPVACKTLTPIPKDKIFEAMKIINSYKIDLPIKIGDVIIDDVFGSKVVATENLD